MAIDANSLSGFHLHEFEEAVPTPENTDFGDGNVLSAEPLFDGPPGPDGSLSSSNGISILDGVSGASGTPAGTATDTTGSAVDSGSAPAAFYGGFESGAADALVYSATSLEGGSDTGATPYAADGGPTPLSASGPLDGTAATSHAMQGQNYIDSILQQMKWGGDIGTGVTVTYSFGTASSVYLPGYSEPTNAFGEFSAHQKAATRMALDYFSNVANITFVEVTDSATEAGTLRFARSGDPSTAWAYGPGTSPVNGDVWVGWSSSYDDMTEGTYGFQTIMHEIGHALGLTHPHDGAVAGTSANDWLGMTIESYKSYEGAANGYKQDFYPATPMFNDIAALQYMYGANTSYNATDTTYSWAAGNQLYETIWDAGGVDTIDWSNQSSNALIDLNDGQWSELGPAFAIDYTVWPWTMESRTLMIAENAVIENATGGSGNDTLIGNEVGNRITGGAGDDAMTGGLGNDTFVIGAGFGNDTITDFTAGAGSDDAIDLSAFGGLTYTALMDATADAGGDAVIMLSGNTLTLTGVSKASLVTDDFLGLDLGGILGSAGADILVGTAGVDSIDGLGGDDVIRAGIGADSLTGGGGNDNLYGEDGDDTLNGDAGIDKLDGGLGAHTLAGGDGNDTYIVDNVGDSVTEGLNAGNDRVESSITYTLGANVENLTLTGTLAIDGTGNALDNALTGNGAANSLIGAAGNDYLYGGAGNDTLSGGDDADTLYGHADDDNISGGAGRDILYGGDGNDTLMGDTGDDSLRGGLGNDNLTGGDGHDYLYGEDGDDALTGGIGIDMLDGGLGADTMAGGAGNDTYVVDNAGDSVTEGAAAGIDRVNSAISYTLGANVENLSLTGAADIDATGNALANALVGNTGANALNGGAGDDFLYAGGGNDVLTGGAGIDRMYGQGGQDTFVYADISEGGDTIVDFTAGAGGDIIDISALLTGLGYGGADPFGDGYARAIQSGADALVQIDGTGGGDSYVTLTTLQGVVETDLTDTNWVV